MMKKTFTPQSASDTLAEGATYSRPLSNRTIERYARDMTAGTWYEDASPPLLFDTNGKLLDGWHRLSAVVMSGKSITFEVRRDVEPEHFAVIDSGRARSGATMERTLGLSYATQIASATNTREELNGRPFGTALSPVARRAIHEKYPLLRDEELHAISGTLNAQYDIPQSGVAGAVAYLVIDKKCDLQELMNTLKVLADYEPGVDSAADALYGLVVSPNQRRNSTAYKRWLEGWNAASPNSRRNRFAEALIEQFV
jgi:hypothetical protein